MTSYKDFAKKIKEKYPAYAQKDDYELAQAMVKKYPQYESKVNFDRQSLSSKVGNATLDALATFGGGAVDVVGNIAEYGSRSMAGIAGIFGFKDAQDTYNETADLLDQGTKDVSNYIYTAGGSRNNTLKQGAIDDASQTDVPFYGGVKEGVDLAKISRSFYNVKEGRSSKEDIQILTDYQRQQEELDKKRENFGYAVGEGLRNSATFGAELLSTGGIGGLIFKGSVKGSTKVIKELLQKELDDVLRKELKKQLRKNLKASAKRGALNLTAQELVHAPSGAYERAIGTIDSNGNITSEGQELGEAFRNSISSTFVETASEFSGGYVQRAMGGVFRLMPKNAKDYVIKSAITQAIKKRLPTVSNNLIGSVASKYGWDGLIGEISEERVGDAMNELLARAGLGDQPFEGISAEQIAQEIFSIGLMTSFTKTAVKKVGESKKINKAIDNESKKEVDIVKKELDTKSPTEIQQELVEEGLNPSTAESITQKALAEKTKELDLTVDKNAPDTTAEVQAKDLLENGATETEAILELSDSIGVDEATRIVSEIAPTITVKQEEDPVLPDVVQENEDIVAETKAKQDKIVEDAKKEQQQDKKEKSKKENEDKAKRYEQIKQIEDKKILQKTHKSIYKEGRALKGKYNGKPYTTNTFILEFSDIKGIEAQTKDTPTTEAVQAIVDKLDKSTVLDITNTAINIPNGFAVILKNKNNDKIGLDIKYYNYFSKKYPDMELRGVDNTSPVGVYVKNKLVGIIMPLNDVAGKEISLKNKEDKTKSDKKKADKSIDKNIKSTNNKDNEKDNNTRGGDKGDGVPKAPQVGKQKSDRTGGDSKKSSGKGDKSELPSDSDKSGKRPATRLTNEQIAEKVEAVTEVSNTGEVLLTGKVTEELKEQANQYTTGGKSKEGRGILDEYYTNSKIVDAVKSLLNFEGTQSLKVLEPSVGVGNFLYALPDTAQHTVDAFEINDTTARIAKIFHQDANINTNSFETLFIDERGNKKEITSDYDLVLGNPPYGDHRGKYKGLGEEKNINKYEEYFIKRGLDLLNKNGTLAMVVPSSFLRSGENNTKIAISAIGKLVNAYRFPTGVFEGTDIGTDLVIFKKRDWEKDMTDLSSIVGDNFFKENPDNVLGTTKKKKNRFGKMEDVVTGTLDEALTLMDANRNKHDAIEVAGKKATSEEVENVQKDLDDGVTKEQAKKTAKAQKTGKKTIKKRIVKSAHKKHTEVVSLDEHFKGEYTDQELELWKATAPDGTVDLTKVEGNKDILNYANGQWYLDFNYAQGDIYAKLKQLEIDYKDGDMDEARYKSQKAKLEAVLPTQEAIDDIILSPNSKFVADLDTGVVDSRTDEPVTLMSSFLDWIGTLPNKAFGDSNQFEVRSYVYNERVTGIDKHRNELIRQRRKRVADDLMRKFLKDGLTPEQQDTVASTYNETFNFYHTPDYSKVPMFADTYKYLEKITKGKVEFDMRPVQKEGVGRLVNKGVGILAHDVGFGKTISGVLANAEYMARGWAKKPLIVAPNENVYAQWVNTIQDLVPNAKLNLLGNLGATYKGDLSSLKIPEGSFTLVTYEGLKKLSFKDETYKSMSEKFKYLSDDLDKVLTKREREKEKEVIEGIAGTLKKGTRADLFFEELGFDLLTFDEIHNANHIVSKVKVKKGEASEFSRFALRPSDLGMKTWLASQYIQEQNGGRNVIGLSATPFTNHPLEYYSILSLVADDSLSKMGFHNVNEFFNTFMEAESEYEFKADGSYQIKKDIRSFKNYRQFRKLLDTYIDFKEGDAKGIKRPNRVQREYSIPANDLMLEMEKQAQEIFKESDKDENGEKTKGAKTLRAINELRKIAFSPYASQFSEAPANYKEFVENSPKLKTLMGLLKQNKKDQKDAGQIVYFDQVGISFMPLVKEYLVKELKYNKEEVEIISGGISKPKRLAIQDKYNNGDIKIILGSEAIKEGMNLQENTTDMYILALPWNFTQLRQVIGRAWRQGNQWSNVRINNLFIEDSIDIFLSQKLENKQRRYEASILSGDQTVDVGDVDFNALKFDLIKDPETRAKLELEAEKSKVNKDRIQAQADFAFATRKIEKLSDLDTSIKDTEKRLEEEKTKYEQELKDNPDDASDWWVKRYEKDLKRDKKARDEELVRLKERGEDVKTLTERKKKMEIRVKSLKKKEEDLEDSFEQRVADIKAEMPARTSFSDDTVKKFVDERAEHNKTFYTKVEKEKKETVSVETVEKPIKARSGKVVKTKKTRKAVVKKKTTKKKTTAEQAMIKILTDKNLTVEERVDKLLGKKQSGKKFKDAGERVAGSKKENAIIQAVIAHGDDAILKQLGEELGTDAVLAQLNKHKILEEEAKPNRETEIMEKTPAWIANYKVNVFKKIGVKPMTILKRGSYGRMWLVNMSDTDAFIAKYPEMLKAFVADLVDIKTHKDIEAFQDKYKNDLGYVRQEVTKDSKEGRLAEIEHITNKDSYRYIKDDAEREKEIAEYKDEAKNGVKKRISIDVLGKNFRKVLRINNVKIDGSFTTSSTSRAVSTMLDNVKEAKEIIENGGVIKQPYIYSGKMWSYAVKSDYSDNGYRLRTSDGNTKESALQDFSDYLGENRIKKSEFFAEIQKEIDKHSGDAINKDYDKFLPETIGGVTKQLKDAEREVARLEKEIKEFEQSIKEGKEIYEPAFTRAKKDLPKAKDFLARLKGDAKTIKHGNFEAIDEYDVKDSRFKKSQVTTDNLMKVYGFKSAQLGNYMDDASSHEHIVQTMGAMEDMSKMLGVDFASIANKTGLSIAFGARGGGKALAHYEPTHNIINLTKKRGDGSFGHEFMHALDWTLGKDTARGKWSGGKRGYGRYRNNLDLISLELTGMLNNGVTIKKPKEYKPNDDVVENYAFKSVNRLREAGKTFEEALKETRQYHYQELADVYRKTFTTDIDVNSNEYYKNSLTYGGGKDTSYWVKSHELWARAFQAYLEDKMKEKGIKNNYLTRKTEGISVYPQGAERIEYNKKFDELFTELAKQYPLDAEKQERAEGVSKSDYALMTATTDKMETLVEDLQDYRDLDKLSDYIKRDSVGASVGIRKAFADNTDVHKAIVLNTIYQNYEALNENYGLFKNTLKKLKELYPDKYKDIESNGSDYTGGALAKVLHTYAYEADNLVAKQKKHEAVPSGKDFGKPRFKERVKTANPLTDGGKFLDKMKKRLKLDFDVEFVNNILINSEKEEAVGVYYRGAIGIVKEFKNTTTPVHEAVHLTLANMSKISAFKGMTAEQIYEAKARTLGIKYDKKKNGRYIDEKLAEDIELYAHNNLEVDGVLKRFYDKIIRLWKKFVRLLKKIERDDLTLIQDYYDIVLFGKSIDRKMVRLENIGNMESFVTDGVLDAEKMAVENARRMGIDLPKFSLKEEKTYRNIKDKYNKNIKLEQEVRNDIETTRAKLENALRLRKIKEEAVQKLLNEDIAKLRKHLTKEQVLSEAGEALAQELGYSAQEVNTTLHEYLKLKTQFEEVHKIVVGNKAEIAQLRKDSATIKADKKEAERRLIFARTKLIEIKKSINKAKQFGKEFTDSVEKARARQVREIVAISKIAGRSTAELVQSSLDTNVDWKSMTDNQFIDFVTELTNLSHTSITKDTLRMDIIGISKAKQLGKLDNLRKAMGYPKLNKMTKPQLKSFKATLDNAQIGDVFLTKRQIETSSRTKFGKVITERELEEKLLEDGELSLEDLETTTLPTLAGFANGLHLKRHSKLLKYVVDNLTLAEVETERKYLKQRKVIEKLAKKARRSRSLSVKERIKQFIAPTDELVFEYIETKNEDKLEFAKNKRMTKEEVAFGNAVIAFNRTAYDYMVATYKLTSRFGEFKEKDYMVHLRRSFLEAVTKEGLKSGVKEMFDGQREAELSMSILDNKTGDIVPYEKWSPFHQFRSGEMKPSHNVTKAHLTYAKTLFRKQAIDSVVPQLLMVMSFRDNFLEKTKEGLSIDGGVLTFVKEYINTARGRKISGHIIPSQGSKTEAFLQQAITATTIMALGFRAGIGVASSIGETVVTLTSIILQPTKLARGVLRFADIKKVISANKAGQHYVGLDPVTELLSPEKGVPEKVFESAMILFSFGRYITHNFALIAEMTQEEYESGKISDKRIAEISSKQNKWKKGQFHQGSLVGATVYGRAFGQYLSWAFDIATTMLSSSTRLLDMARKREFSKARKSEYMKDVMSFVAMSIVMGLLSQLIGADDDDKKNKTIKFYIAREMNTLISAFPALLRWNNYKGEIDPVIPILRTGVNLVNLFIQLITQEEYKRDGKGFGIGDKKFKKTAKKLLVPVALQGIVGNNERVNTKYKMIKEGADPLDILSVVDKKWYEKDIIQKKKAIKEVEILIAVEKYYGGLDNELNQIILKNIKNEEKLKLLLDYSKRNGKQETRALLLKMRLDKRLNTGRNKGKKGYKGEFISDDLWKDYKNKIKKY